MRVMLVDDSIEIRSITAKLLRCHGHNVIDFHDPRIALMAIRNCVDLAIDVVITDYMMPGLNGMELAKRIVAEYPLIPIIMYSACDPIALRQYNKKAGDPVKLIFQKPVKSEDLHNGILAVYMQACSNRLIMQKCSCGFPDKSLTHACPHIKLEEPLERMSGDEC